MKHKRNHMHSAAISAARSLQLNRFLGKAFLAKNIFVNCLPYVNYETVAFL